MADMLLQGKTVVITGASRGIGRAIALRCAAAGANVVIAAKSDQPHPKLSGTIHSVAEEVEAAGGKALAFKLDVRSDDNIAALFEAVEAQFGGIDILVNNAGAISLTPVAATSMKRYDLMHSINARAVLACSSAALPYLEKSDNPHILSLSPPINLKLKWLKPFIPYTSTKYGMTLLSLGMAEEFRSKGIAVNTLWPRTTIATAAIEHEISAELMEQSRTPAIMADAAFEIVTSPAKDITGQNFLDEALLREKGITEFDHYKVDPNCDDLFMDLYVD